MLTLDRHSLTFTFPEVHPEASLRVVCHRTLRVPDGPATNALPPSLGRFPLVPVEDLRGPAAGNWNYRGGVALPVRRAEAMWLSFESAMVGERGRYPFAIRIAAGKINAVTGQPWQDGPPDAGDGTGDGHVVVPRQKWLDGFATNPGVVRQFVAVPLGEGITAEEQITGDAWWGGLQLQVFPMRRADFDWRFPPPSAPESSGAPEVRFAAGGLGLALGFPLAQGLGLGGRIKQQVFADPYAGEWDFSQSHNRCFVHLLEASQWRAATGHEPPHAPPTALDYTNARLPWYSHYDEQLAALSGSARLAGLDTVSDTAAVARGAPLFTGVLDDAPVSPQLLLDLSPRR